MNKIDFSTYKQNISIRDAAVMAGYYPLPGKSSAGSVVMVCGNEKIVIMRPGNKEKNRYFNTGNDNDKGDLITFINNRLDIFKGLVSWQETRIRPGAVNIPAVVAVLNWMDGKYLSPEMQTQLGVASFRQPRQFSLNDYDIRPLDDNGLAFLKNRRCISEKTIWKFKPFISMCRNLSNEKFKSYNIAFPYHVPGSDIICNFELRNYSYKGHAEGGNKSTASWIADFSVSHLITQEVFLFESAIDAMSYAELHEHEIKFDMVAFISLGGSISAGQIIELQKYYPSARFHMCFDNDLQGHMYDIRVACILEGRTLMKIESPVSVKYTLDGKQFEIPKKELNYSRFKKESGCVRISLYIHKPKSIVDVVKDGEKKTIAFKDHNECLTYIKLHPPKKPFNFSNSINKNVAI